MPEKRYYWFKLQEDFFNRKEVKLLRQVAGGDTYTVIYLEMLLKSLKTNGKLYFEGIGDNFVEELALDIDEAVENVQVTVEYLRRKGLLLSSDEYEYELTSIKSLVGSESSGAERKRRQREREKQQLIERDNVTGQSRLGHVEIEKDIDIELEKEKDRLRSDETDDNYSNSAATAAMVINRSITDNDLDFAFGPIQRQELVEYVTEDGMDVDVVADAIKLTKDSNQSSFKYTDGILKNRLAKHLLTMGAVIDNEKKRNYASDKYGDKQKKEIW